MRFQREEQNGIQVIKLSGELNRIQSKALSAELEALIQNDRPYILLDVEETRFIDSGAIMQLLRMMREALSAGGNIKLLRPRQGVKRFLSLGRVLELFECYETRVDALRSFNIEKKRASDVEAKRNAPLKEHGKRQREVILRLVQLLIKKKQFRSDEFMQELSRTQRLIFDIYRSSNGGATRSHSDDDASKNAQA